MSTFTAKTKAAAGAAVGTPACPEEATSPVSSPRAALETPELGVSCAWCSSVLTPLGWRNDALAGPTTHGICPSCFAAAAPGVPYPTRLSETRHS